MRGFQIIDKEHTGSLNRLAREKMKEKLLLDIMFDLQVCEIEGWDKKEYINELRELINSIGGPK